MKIAPNLRRNLQPATQKMVYEPYHKKTRWGLNCSDCNSITTTFVKNEIE
jgi:hypothetical protein